MAEFHIVHEGYLPAEDDDDRVGSTTSFARDGDTLVVIDPGLARSRDAILDPLAALGVEPDDVTDVVISHHHPTTRSTSPCSRRRASTTTGPGIRTIGGSRGRPRASSSRPTSV